MEKEKEIDLILNPKERKQHREVIKLMNYLQGHLFNKIHIEHSVAESC